MTDNKNLLRNNKQLMKEWDFEKNTHLDLDTLTTGSSKVAFWKCEKGHTWEKAIKYRTKGEGCPYCANKKVWKGDNDLETQHPEIAKQWHPTKNGELKPEMVTPGSRKKVWWKCEKGHEWQARVYDRSRGGGCPYCSGKKAWKGETDFATLHPELVKEWHPTKNGELKPDMVTAGSGEKVWWRCEIGHEWEARIAERNRGDGCPYCSGRKVWKGYNDFATLYPELAKEWHPTKNGELKPDMITAGSGEKVWWMCEKGHEWQATVSDRSRGDKCPYCSGNKVWKGDNDFATLHPKLAKEWHPTKNGELKPDMITAGSGRKIWWMCENGHEWQTTIYARTRGSGCPHCKNKTLKIKINDLRTINPELAKQWHPTKNGELTPEMVTAKSPKKVWWKCEKGHEWQARVVDRTKGGGCPYCSGRKAWTGENDFATLYPKLAKEWHPTKNGELKPEMVTAGSGRKVWWICEHGHEWETQVRSRVNGSGCPVCFQERRRTVKKDIPKEKSMSIRKKSKQKFSIQRGSGTSYEQEALYFYIKQVDKTAVNRDEINGCEVDIHIPSLNIGIEYDGEYYHRGREKKDAEKNRILKEAGLTLIRIKEKTDAELPVSFSAEGEVPTFTYLPTGRKYLNTLIQEVILYVFGELPERIDIDKDDDLINEASENDFRENSLAAKYPEIAKQWHPTKNGDKKPNDYLPGSGRKVWWVCEKGHEWKVGIGERVHGYGCPYCANRLVWEGFNDLQTRYPKIAKQWHPTKNGNLKPNEVTYGAERRVWWKCDVCGYEWNTKVQARTFRETGCPACSGNKVHPGFNDLKTLNPELAKQWHPTKNGDLKPDMITAGSSKKVWWMCENGHEWQAIISDRNRGNGCPYCNHNDFVSENPKLAKEWHPTKNGNLTPEKVTIGSPKKVWWVCENGHEYQAIIKNRKNGHGCPYCAGKKTLKGYNDLETTNPELAKEWHPTKNGKLKPDMITAGSSKNIWWICEHGHEYQARVINRTTGHGCPYCAGSKVLKGFNDLKTKYPEIAKEWHPTKNGDLTPEKVTIGSTKKVWWICEHGHEWQTTIYTRTRGSGCPICYKLGLKKRGDGWRVKQRKRAGERKEE